MDRKHTRPTPQSRHIKPKNLEQPKKYIPPPEARLRILQNIQIVPPEVSRSPPPLVYRNSIRNVKFIEQTKDKKNDEQKSNAENDALDMPTLNLINELINDVLTKNEKIDEEKLTTSAAAANKISTPIENNSMSAAPTQGNTSSNIARNSPAPKPAEGISVVTQGKKQRHENQKKRNTQLTNCLME